MPSLRLANLLVATAAIATALTVARPASARRGAPRTHGEVTYVLRDRLYVDLGSADGLQKGAEVSILTAGKLLAKATVIEVGASHSIVRYESVGRLPRPHDQVVANVTLPVEPTAEPSPAIVPQAAGASRRVFVEATRRGYPKVTYAGSPHLAATAYRGRAEAQLRNAVWWSADAGSAAGFARSYLDLYVSGPLDDEGAWVLDLDVSAVGQPRAPATTRTRPKTGAWLEAYRATLSYRGWEGLGLGLGRNWDPALRYGQVDGAHVTWDVTPALRLRLAGGARPELASLEPTTADPVVLVAADGVAGSDAVWASYDAALMWLSHPRDHLDAGEASLAARVELFRMLSFHADVAGVWQRDATGQTAAVVDRLTAGTVVRLSDRATLRMAGRRLQEPGLALDLSALPSAYLSARTADDGYAYLDASVWHGELLTLDASMSGGVIREENSSPRAWWLSPGVAWRLKGGWGFHGRLAYHGEDGLVAAHLGEFGLGVTPNERLRLDITAQGGVLIALDHHQLLFTQRTWLRLGYVLTEQLDVGLSGRLDLGDVGSHAFGILSLAGHDLL